VTTEAERNRIGVKRPLEETATGIYAVLSLFEPKLSSGCMLGAPSRRSQRSKRRTPTNTPTDFSTGSTVYVANYGTRYVYTAHEIIGNIALLTLVSQITTGSVAAFIWTIDLM
jgi:3D (Asp-Asp-Asp) domain-containing protein